MQLSLLKQNVIYTCVLPNKKKGQYWINQLDGEGNTEKVIGVEGVEGQWILQSNRYATIQDAQSQRLKEITVEPMSMYKIHLKKSEETAILFAEPITADRKQYSKLVLPASGEITIGRVDGCDLQFDNRYTSSQHAELLITNDRIEIVDKNSANGTFVNGERISNRVLKPGDVVYIIGFKIIIGKGFIAINNPDGKVTYNKKIFQTFAKQAIIPALEDEYEDEEIQGDLFYRSPRFKRDVEKKIIKIDSPPSKEKLEQTPLMLMLGPSITMGMASLSMGAFTLSNVLQNNGNIMNAMPTLTMSFSMVIGMILWPVLTRKYENKRKARREKQRNEKYKQYIQSIRKEISEVSGHQSAILHENFVPLQDCLDRINHKRRNLWERTHRQQDFLKLRLGLGNLPLVAEITYPEKRFTLDDDELQDELYRLAEEPKLLENVPISLSLTEDWVSGIIGHRQQAIQLVKGLIFQLAALHSYDELKLAFIYDPKEQELWDFVKWLPHVWQHEKGVRLIATNPNELKELSAFLDKEFAIRRSITNEEERKEVTPHYVIFALDKGLCGKSEVINNVMKEKKNFGFSVVNLHDELKNLPKECSIVVECSDYEAKIYDKDDITGQSIAFHPDVLLEQGELELAVKLANIQLDASSSSYILPNMLTFLDLFEVGKIEYLNSLTRWKENDPTLSLETPIGVDTSGERFYLDLHEKFHGPHGLIAGMTGSGKSEFIMTFILSLAVNYHPYEVAFILIDYKGGGMANAFSNLPHLAGTITNLDGAAVNRSLVSIQSELKRRQSLFGEASKRLNISNMDIYKYQKLFRDGLVDEPLQHLFIISDEFAELKTQQPEFMEQLVSAARIGRSLGVHLILATQKPSGVVDDQIWSNSRFRISLKVQEKADSMDVIKRPDAAELSVTGRFYVQVGFNELFELGQSAWAGAPYYPTDRIETKKDQEISIIDNLGRVVKQVKLDKRKAQLRQPLKQIDEINKYLSAIASEEKIKVRPLWLEPIPAVITLSELYSKYGNNRETALDINPIIGEVDDPANQRQFALTFPLTSEGNAIIYGAAGSGEMLFVTTLLYALMDGHTPNELNMYIMDFGAETLRAFANAPHVGDVLLLDDSEKITNLFSMLYKEIETRKKLFSNYGGDIRSYIQGSGEKLASILVVIHNYSAFSETYDQHEDKIAYLTREGLKYGIYFVLTAQNSNAVRYRIQQNFKQLYVLQMNDQSDYTGLLGNVNGVHPSKHVGRGIVRKDVVYEYQIAHIHSDIDNMLKFVRDYCSQYEATWNGNIARRIPILPARVDVPYLLGDPASKLRKSIPIGVDRDSLQVVSFGYSQAFIQLVISQEGRHYGVMQGIAEAISTMADTKLVVLDSLEAFVEDANRKYELVTGVEPIEQAVIDLYHVMLSRNHAYKDAITAGEVTPSFDKLTYIITSFSEFKTPLSRDAASKLQALLDNGSLDYNINLLICDSSANVSGYSYEAWFKNNTALSDGIYVGNGLTSFYHFKLENYSNDLYKELEQSFGYLLVKGKPKLVKLITSVTDTEDEAIG